MLKIYGRRTSFNVQKVMWLVNELKVPHQRIDIGGKFGGLDKPEFLALNPNGKIPVIDDSGVIVWESNAIVRYIADKHGKGTWSPADPGQRAQADQWMDWYLNHLNPGFMGIFLDYFKVPEPKRDQALIGRHIKAAMDAYALVERCLEKQPNMLGEQITVADIPIAASLYRLYTIGIPVPKMPNIEAWYERLKKRPAYAEHVMVDYAELRGY
ncbi:MAG: glutathione S-transferase family protein [Rhodospirillaceae bacterium]|nr:glutathione S-transferase family protein [Rhodospirillaceae bacterium]